MGAVTWAPEDAEAMAQRVAHRQVQSAGMTRRADVCTCTQERREVRESLTWASGGWGGHSMADGGTRSTPGRIALLSEAGRAEEGSSRGHHRF